MKSTALGVVLIALVGSTACNVNAGFSPTTVPFCGGAHGTLQVLCAITIPGSPLVSGGKGWIDPSTNDYYYDDQSNNSVDIVNAQTFTYVGRVPGFVGAAPPITYGGGTATSNGQGPNSIVPTGNGTVWISDGNANVQVVNISSMTIVKTISTAMTSGAYQCDGGTATTHFCGRTNEMTYDPNDQIIMVETPNPLSYAYCSNPATAAACATAAAISYPTTTPLTMPSYATFINASTYAILGQISFTDVAGTTEAPVWDAAVGGTGRFLVPVPSCSAGFVGTTCSSAANGATQYVAVIDPKNLAQYAGTYSAATAIAGSTPYAIPNCTALGSAGNTGMINDMTLDSADQTVIMPACGHEVVFNAMNGTVLNGAVISQVGSSDETSFNKADGNFYVVATVPTGLSGAGAAALGQISGKTGNWIQNVANPAGKDPAGDGNNNRVFTFVTVTAAQAAAGNDSTACAQFGYKGIGCITVFGQN